MRTLVMLVLAVLLTSAPADALVMYDFSGTNAAGTFTLDETQPFVFDNGSFFTSALFTSPFTGSFTGTFGVLAVAGTAVIQMIDVFNDSSFLQDQWIVRLTFAGGGLVTGINLFESFPAGFTNPNIFSLTPPTVSSPSLFNFSYAVTFADGTFQSGALTSLVGPVHVPEPSAGALLALAVGGALLFHRVHLVGRGNG